MTLKKVTTLQSQPFFLMIEAFLQRHLQNIYRRCLCFILSYGCFLCLTTGPT